MSRIVAFGHRRPGHPMVTRFDQSFFRKAPARRIAPGNDDRVLDLMRQGTPLAAAPVESATARRPLLDRIITVFLVFTLGVFAGYLWAAAAYGKLSIS